MNLEDLGLHTYATHGHVDLSAYSHERLARVIEEHKTRWILESESGQLSASVRGAVHHNLESEAFPKVGDWVVYEPAGEGKATIETVLPRKTMVARKNIHGTGMQIIVSNIDTVAIVQAVDQDFAIPKLERYFQIAQESGATPLFILTKVDKHTDVSAFIQTLNQIAPGVPVIVLSSVTRAGFDALAMYVRSHETLVLLGASGAGKSTLLNALMESNIQETQEVRSEDGKGRHTTTRRSLFMLPSGGLVIDTPGMRELTLVDEKKKKDVFEDVEEIAYGCRFPNCDHVKSLDCAVLAAVESGVLSSERYEKCLQFLAKQKKLADMPRTDGNQHSNRIKSNRAQLNYESRRQSEE